jgi:archaellin
MKTRIIRSGALALVFAVASCSDAVGVNGAAGTEVSFGAATSVGATAAVAASIPVTAGGHTLDLQHVTLVVTKLELERSHGVACVSENESDDGDHNGSLRDDECEEIKIGPTTVELQTSGALTTITGPALPAGTFREIEVRISQVRLRGTFDGQAFDVTVDVHVRPELSLDPPLVVTDGTPTSITVQVPLANWFVNFDGSLINPAQLASNTTLQATIRSRIAGSFHAFEDRDHDGHDDHHARD